MKIMAVVVTFNPDKQAYENIRKLSQQIDFILVVDNSLKSSRFVLQQEGIEVVYNSENLGIGKALNLGLDYAIQHDFDWLFTFDQDSQITDNFVRNMISTNELYEKKEKIQPVLICPTYIHPDDAIVYDNAKETDNEFYVEVETAMTSGNALNISLLKDKNIRFKEAYFIDFVDHEFCFHLRKVGYKIIQSLDAPLIHSLGEVKEKIIFGKTLTSTNHNAVRRYYITRNRLDVYRNYFSQEKKWIKIDFVNSIMEFVKIILIEDQKSLKVLNIFRGTKDALLNNWGPYRYTK